MVRKREKTSSQYRHGGASRTAIAGATGRNKSQISTGQPVDSLRCAQFLRHKNGRSQIPPPPQKSQNSATCLSAAAVPELSLHPPTCSWCRIFAAAKAPTHNIDSRPPRHSNSTPPHHFSTQLCLSKPGGGAGRERKAGGGISEMVLSFGSITDN